MTLALYCHRAIKSRNWRRQLAQLQAHGDCAVALLQQLENALGEMLQRLAAQRRCELTNQRNSFGVIEGVG